MMPTVKDPHLGPPTARAEVTSTLRGQVSRVVVFCRRALRYWGAALVAVTLGAAASAAYLRFQPPTYRSETLLLHTDGIAATDSSEQATAPRNIAARVQEILTSRQLLERVLDEFNLYPDVRRQYGPVDAVDELRKHIQFKAPGGNTFRIAFDGDSPGEAERVTARLAELVIGRDSELRSSQALLTQDFLSREKTGTDGRLQDAERQLASFLSTHPRFALDTAPLTNGAAVRASVQATSRAAPRWTVIQQAHPAPSATVPASPAPVSSRAPSPAMREAAAALATARASLAEKSYQFTPAHPDVRAAQAAVARAESRFADAEAVDEARANMPATAAAADAPLPPTVARAARYALAPAEDAGSMAPAEKDLVALETEWATLTRSVIEARQHQDQVEAALFKAQILASSVSDDHHGSQMSVIDRAYVPQRPVPPGRSTIAAIAGGATVLLGALVMLLCAALDDRIFLAADVEGLADVLVQVPRVRRRRRAHAPT